MKQASEFTSRRRLLFLAGMSSIPIFGIMRGSLLNAQDKTGFPDGFDAVEAAPESYKVLFESAIVRVLQVEVAPGTKEPMHNHRWPSIFLNWDAGGRTGHIRIYHADGSVHDVPSREMPVFKNFQKTALLTRTDGRTPAICDMFTGPGDQLATIFLLNLEDVRDLAVGIVKCFHEGAWLPLFNAVRFSCTARESTSRNSLQGRSAS
jgi:hypothetical protein